MRPVPKFWHLLILVSAGSLFFHHLGKQPLMHWDEGRLAVNAAWVLKTQDWLVMRGPTGSPDLWNTKPPLHIWLQALSMRAFGYTEFAHRLPAALAGWLSTLLLYYFGWKVIHQPRTGLLAAVILATSPGFVGFHVARTGDYDALLTLFITGYLLAFWAFLKTNHHHYLLLSTFLLILALYTKCAAALLPLPALGTYLLFTSTDRAKLKDVRIWLALLVACLSLGVYYLLREYASPGYLEATWVNDWAGRVDGSSNAGTHFFWWIYLQDIFTTGLFVWVPFLGLAAGIASYFKQTFPSIGFFAAWQVIGTLLLLTFCRTRLVWYDAQVYPFIALFIAVALGRVWPVVRHGRWAGPTLSIVVFTAAAATWYREAHRAEILPESGLLYGIMLKRIQASEPRRTPVILLRENFNSSLDFWLLTMPTIQRKRFTVQVMSDTTVGKLQSAQEICGCLPEYYTEVAKHFYTTPVLGVAPCWYIRLGDSLDK